MCQAGDVYSQQKVEKESDMEITRVAVDIAKNVFQIHGADRCGRPKWKRQLRRATYGNFLAGHTFATDSALLDDRCPAA
jgi:hypothetical protein